MHHVRPCACCRLSKGALFDAPNSAFMAIVDWYTGPEGVYACRARQIEDQNRQLAGHANRVEQQQAEMALQLRELTKRLQQTSTENEQLSEEIRSLRDAVKVIRIPRFNAWLCAFSGLHSSMVIRWELC